MTTATEHRELKSLLCEQWCAGATVREAHGRIQVSLPIRNRDGDHVSAWITPIAGGWKVSDAALTLMRLSYETDLDKIMEGTRRRVLDTILVDAGLELDDGEIGCEVPEGQLGEAIMRLGHAITRLQDLGLWNRARVESTFNEDLRTMVQAIVGADKVATDYIVPDIAQADDYPIDLRIETARKPVFVFGVGSKDKARLTTISIQHFLRYNANFESMVVFSDIRALPASDARRLLNVADASIDSLDAEADLRRKLESRMQ